MMNKSMVFSLQIIIDSALAVYTENFTWKWNESTSVVLYENISWDNSVFFNGFDTKKARILSKYVLELNIYLGRSRATYVLQVKFFFFIQYFLLVLF